MVLWLNLLYFIFFGVIVFKIGLPELVEIFPRALFVCKKMKDKKELEKKIEMQKLELKLMKNRTLLEEMGINPGDELKLNMKSLNETA